MPRKRRSSNTGSIFKDKYGYWNAQVFQGYRDGHANYKRKRAKSESEVVAWLNKEIAATPNEAPPEKLTLEAWLLRWLEAGKRSWAYKTHKGYAQICTDHLIPALGRILLNRLTRAQVQNLLDRLTDAKKARNTIRNVRATLRKALTDAKNDGLIADNVALYTKLPKKKQQPPAATAFTPEQAQIFLAAVFGDRLRALYWLTLLLGLRFGEVLGLRVEDVDLEKRILHITGALQLQKGKWLVRVDTKNEASRVGVPLPGILVDILREHLAQRAEEATYAKWKETGFLFTTKKGAPLYDRNISRSYKKILIAADLPNIRFHDLRHSCATLLISLNIHPRIVMEILRHAQISTTMNIYAHVIPEANRHAAEALSELLTPTMLEIPAKKPQEA